MKFSIVLPILIHLFHLVAASPTVAPGTVNFVTEYVVERSDHDLEERSLICKLDIVLLAFKAVAALATPFCSSYLHIPTSTSVVVTTALTTTTTTATTTYTEPAYVPRAVNLKAVPTPPGLGVFVASQISSACSCLSIPETVVVTTSTAPTRIVTSTTTTTVTTSPSPACTNGQEVFAAYGACACGYVQDCTASCIATGSDVLAPLTGSPEPDYLHCLEYCDDTLPCNYYYYNPSTEFCNIYNSPPNCVSGSGVYGYKYPGSCLIGQCNSCCD